MQQRIRMTSNNANTNSGTQNYRPWVSYGPKTGHV